MEMTTAIVLAGGTGTRIKKEHFPKQYINVNGKPIIQYVLETVFSMQKINNCVIIAGKDWQDEISNICGGILKKVGRQDMLYYFAVPGTTRQLSIYNALLSLENNISSDSTVVIIDACRPNMTTDLLHDVIIEAEKCDGAIPVLPMKDTVYLSKDKKAITGLLNRQEVFAGQAPEAFKFEKYFEANRVLLPERILSINGSTEPAILSRMDIHLVDGDEHNYKITTDEDLERFRKECEERSNTSA